MIRQALLLAGLAVGPIPAQPVPLPEPNYCFGFLRSVPDRATLPEAEAMRIQKEHLAHLTALGEKRWLVGAGPILTPGGLRGLLISKCASVAEANELAGSDPAVTSKRLFVETYRWTGPPGIGERYWQEKSANPDYKVRMQKYPLALLKKSSSWKDWPPKEIFMEHVSHVMGVMKQGKLSAAGPFHDGGQWLGVFIFTAGMTPEEGRALAEADPMVKAGFATVEALEWLAADGTFRSSTQATH
jgi:uncharacterized protein YciI